MISFFSPLRSFCSSDFLESLLLSRLFTFYLLFFGDLNVLIALQLACLETVFFLSLLQLTGLLTCFFTVLVLACFTLLRLSALLF